MKKLLAIFILFAVCLTFAGCTKAPTKGTNTVSSSDVLSVTSRADVIHREPPNSIIFAGKGLAKLRSFDTDDKEGIFGLLTSIDMYEEGIYGTLFVDCYGEEDIYKIIDFLRALKLPEIKGAEITDVGIYPERNVYSAYSKKIEITYRFNSPAESDICRVMYIEYTYASDVTLEQRMNEYSQFGGEITVCKDGIKAAGLTERTTNAEDHRTICFAELEGFPVKITFRYARKNDSVDIPKPSEPINAELLDILKNDVTFTSFFANDASDQTAD